MATQLEDRVQVTRHIHTLSRISWNSSDSRSPNRYPNSVGPGVRGWHWLNGQEGHIGHPSFQGLHADKQARSVRRETPAAVKVTEPFGEKRSEK
jgi:hypothetical protein